MEGFLLLTFLFGFCYVLCFIAAWVFRYTEDRKSERDLVRETEQFLKDNTRLDT